MVWHHLLLGVPLACLQLLTCEFSQFWSLAFGCTLCSHNILCYFASSHRAGETIAIVGGMSLLAAAPVSIMIDQRLIETARTTSTGEKKKTSYLEQSLFAIGCCMDDGPKLVPLDILVKLDSPSAGTCIATSSSSYHPLRRAQILTTLPVFLLSVTERKSCDLLQFRTSTDDIDMSGTIDDPPSKRSKHEINGVSSSTRSENIMVEVFRFTGILSETVDSLTT
jgi:hypothetical protein